MFRFTLPCLIVFGYASLAQADGLDEKLVQTLKSEVDKVETQGCSGCILVAHGEKRSA